MASKQEIEQHLKIALEEIGSIQPWYDNEVHEWIFNHPLYPVECGGCSEEEVKTKYPLYLREFIDQRLNNNLSPLNEKITKGRGGHRPGAGRPKSTHSTSKRRIYLPVEIANWVQQHIPLIEKLMHKEHAKRR